MPNVSAVIVTYRSADAVGDLLHDLRGWVNEIVVVDNASDDDTLHVVAEAAPHAIVERLETNQGFAAAVNVGVDAAAGELILLCNPDLRLASGAVAELVAGAGRHPGDTVGPLLLRADGGVQLSRRGFPTLWNLLGEELLGLESAAPGAWPLNLWARWGTYDEEVAGPILAGACLLIPRAAWDEVGPFDDGYFLYWEEVDWQLRARQHGRTTWLVPTAVATHTRAASTGLHDPRRAELLHQSTRRFVKKWFLRERQRQALAIIAAGQALRLAMWSGPLRRRAGARQRAAFHRAALVALTGRTPT